MPDILSMRDTSALNTLHEGDVVFVPADSVARFNYNTNQFDGKFIDLGQYTVGAWTKVNGIDIRQIGQPYERDGRSMVEWFYVSPSSEVYLIEDSLYR